MQEINKQRVRIKGGMSREQRKVYMKEYMKGYMKKYNGHKHNKINGDLTGYIFVSLDNLPVIIESKPINEETLEIEDEHCIVWGCGKKLGLREKLFGKRCISCQNIVDESINYAFLAR